ncbi:MAG: hypothetical protein K2L49_06440 [Muribaculaceae bacterium]|nr:hypothetical protein [Muribaculaceae bacterium]
MKITYTSQQMLEEWKLRRAIGPMRADCTVTRSDGIDLDALLTAEMRGWYLRLLDTAPPEMLAPEDISALVEITIDSTTGALIVILPPQCRRVIEVKLKGWTTPAAPRQPDRYLSRLTANPFTSPDIHRPVAIAGYRSLTLLPLTSALPESLIAVMDHGDDIYTFDQRALELITPDNSLLP